MVIHDRQATRGHLRKIQDEVDSQLSNKFCYVPIQLNQPTLNVCQWTYNGSILRMKGKKIFAEHNLKFDNTYNS